MAAARGAVVELFVELVMVRVAIIDRSKELPADMMEAITSLIYAAQVPGGAPPPERVMMPELIDRHHSLAHPPQIPDGAPISPREVSTCSVHRSRCQFFDEA